MPLLFLADVMVIIVVEIRVEFDIIFIIVEIGSVVVRIKIILAGRLVVTVIVAAQLITTRLLMPFVVGEAFCLGG